MDLGWRLETSPWIVLWWLLFLCTVPTHRDARAAVVIGIPLPSIILPRPKLTIHLHGPASLGGPGYPWCCFTVLCSRPQLRLSHHGFPWPGISLCAAAWMNWMWMLSLRVRIVLHKPCIDMIFPGCASMSVSALWPRCEPLQCIQLFLSIKIDLPKEEGPVDGMLVMQPTTLVCILHKPRTREI